MGLFEDQLSDEEKQKIADSLNRDKPALKMPKPEQSQLPPGKDIATNMGISDAPASSYQSLSGLFAPKDATYKAYGKGGAAPPVPALNRQGGPLDISAAGAVGSGIDTAKDPSTYMGGGLALGGIKNIAKQELPNIGYGYFGKLKGMIQETPKNLPSPITEVSNDVLKPSINALNSAVKLPASHPDMVNLRNNINKIMEEKGQYSPELKAAQQFYNKKLE